MTPAALNAALSGDMENFIAATTPGGIEAQEKRGQIEQSFLTTLPKNGTSGEDRKQWESLGFVFQDDEDDIFINALFPLGWRKKPTEHDMWTELLDGKGRKRGSIFYKAAFYDRSAHVHLERRFSVSDDYASPERTVYIIDACGKVEKKISGLKAPDYGDRTEARKRNDAIDAASKSLADWLAKEYPDWQSPLAYWNADN